MMGRSHAFTAGVGYAALDMLSTLPVPFNRAWLAGAWIASAAVLVVIAPMRPPKPNERRESELSSTGRANLAMHRLAFNSALGVLLLVVVAIGALALTQALRAAVPGIFAEEPLAKLVWICCAAGFGLLPDIDEPGSTVSRWLGPLSQLASKATRRVSGGHRWATHSWVMVLVGLIVALASIHVRELAGIMLSISFLFAARMLLPDRARGSQVPVLLMAVALAWLATIGQIQLTPIALAVPAGILLHIAGDWVTNSGVGFLWPRRTKYALRIFGTNTGVEHHIVFPLLSIAMAATMVFWIFIPLVSWSHAGGLDSMLNSVPALPVIGSVGGK